MNEYTLSELQLAGDLGEFIIGLLIMGGFGLVKWLFSPADKGKGKGQGQGKRRNRNNRRNSWEPSNNTNTASQNANAYSNNTRRAEKAKAQKVVTPAYNYVEPAVEEPCTLHTDRGCVPSMEASAFSAEGKTPTATATTPPRKRPRKATMGLLRNRRTLREGFILTELLSHPRAFDV